MYKLLLPIIFPSWRFFSSVGPSPRIEVGFVADKIFAPQEWLAFRPLPQKINFTLGLQRLLHNSQWNEQLYINTCAEHLFDEYSEFREREIALRLVAAVLKGEIAVKSEFEFLVFRIRALAADAGQVSDDVVFVSQPFSLKVLGKQQ